MKELRVCAEVAERLAEASDQAPSDKAKVEAAVAAFKRYQVAKGRATPEAVADEYRVVL